MAVLDVACRCGEVRGTVDYGLGCGNHIRCHCDDCQRFARFVDEDLLDDAGGTPILQVPLAALKVESGHDKLALVRLSETGMRRWYTTCCRTPVGNTMASPKVPFVGVPTVFVKGDVAAVAGPVVGLQGRFATGPTDAHPRAPVGQIWKTVRGLTGWWWRGLHEPSPFPHDVEAEVLEGLPG